jgi:hypothetical protein
MADPATTPISIPSSAESITNPSVVEDPIATIIVSIHIEENATTIISTIGITPYLPETSQVLSTWVTWNSIGDPVTSVSTMAITTYIAHSTQQVSTQTSFQKTLHTISSVDT